MFAAAPDQWRIEKFRRFVAELLGKLDDVLAEAGEGEEWAQVTLFWDRLAIVKARQERVNRALEIVRGGRRGLEENPVRSWYDVSGHIIPREEPYETADQIAEDLEATYRAIRQLAAANK